MTYTTVHLTDKTSIRAFLNHDRALTAYALGDLDDAFWPQSTFYGALYEGKLVALALLYHGLDPVVLLAFGEPAGVRAIFANHPFPDEIFYLFPQELVNLLSECYERPHSYHEWRMVLDPKAFVAPESNDVSRIRPEHSDLLAELYCHAAAPGEEILAFSPWQIAHGIFYGVWVDDILVATAGTHVWSQTEKVIAIGNVFTRPEYRNNGYATQCAASIVRDALAAGIDPIILNVRSDNIPAIRVYEKLGFYYHHTFSEGPGLKKKKSR